MTDQDGSVTIIALERHEFVAAAPFDEVVARVHAGLGRPDFVTLQRRLHAIDDWEATRKVVAEAAGPSGLMVFLELDLGRVIAEDPLGHPAKALRIIAGNPVTMESMARTTPEAGAFAPVTILLFESQDGVHVRYDTLTSAVGHELTDDARGHADALDRSVLQLLRDATSA